MVGALVAARLDKVGCLLVAQSGHDGLARALEPAHTTLDGDAPPKPPSVAPLRRR